MLAQQNLTSLLPTTPDHWTNLTSGFALDGGAGPALARTDAQTLASTAPAASFQLRAAVADAVAAAVADADADVAPRVGDRGGELLAVRERDAAEVREGRPDNCSGTRPPPPGTLLLVPVWGELRPLVGYKLE